MPPAAAQVRLYRVRSLFQFLEYNLSFSLLNVTIVRNLAVSPSSGSVLQGLEEVQEVAHLHKVALVAVCGRLPDAPVFHVMSVT